MSPWLDNGVFPIRPSPPSLMRRQEKELIDPDILKTIISKAQVCRLAMIHNNRPYVVPLSFGFHNNSLYFHGALKGKKIEAIRHNPDVCFEFDQLMDIVEAEKACKWGARYQSIIGFGQAELLWDRDEKRRALQIIMAQYSDREFDFPDEKLNSTAVIQLTIKSMTGKQA